jgi:hypothetical protein
MNEFDIKRLALVYALQADIEAMKVSNKQRDDDNPLYDADQFYLKSDELQQLAAKHNDQL